MVARVQAFVQLIALEACLFAASVQIRGRVSSGLSLIEKLAIAHSTPRARLGGHWHCIRDSSLEHDSWRRLRYELVGLTSRKDLGTALTMTVSRLMDVSR